MTRALLLACLLILGTAGTPYPYDTACWTDADCEEWHGPDDAPDMLENV